MAEEVKPVGEPEQPFVPPEGVKLEHIDGLIGTVSTAPTHTPRTFSEQFAIYKNGSVERFYWFDVNNNEWNYTALTTLAKEGSSALSGAVTLSEGTNITLTQTGQDIEIAASFTDTDSTLVEFTAAEAITEDDAVCAYGGNTYSIDLESGSSQYLSRADNATLSITGDLTIELNVRLESQPTGSEYYFVTKWDENGVNDRSYALSYRDDGGTFKILLRLSSNGTASNTREWTKTLSNATWYHLALVYTSGSSSAELFVDGSSEGTGTGTLPSAISDEPSSFFIGAITGGAGVTGYTDGLIDDVRIWNTTRTGTQISTNRSVELAGNESGLVGYWRLNNNLLDWTSNGQTLTNNGSASFSTTVPFAGTAGVIKASAANTARANTFIGFANETIASGAAGDIKINGVKTGLTGLTAGVTHYLSDTAGAISTSAGTNNRKVGIATSTTSLFIKHDNV